MFKFSLFLLLLFFVPSTFAHSQTFIIEMTSGGFSPQSVTLDKNSTVIFINKDSKTRWPASNDHPTHDLYPQFDPQKAIEPGQSWPFKPTEAGVWKFHDHIYPHMGGLLTVTPEVGEKESSSWTQNIKSYIMNFFSKIKNPLAPKFILDAAEFTKLDPQDQFSGLKKYADSKGAEKAWQFIKEIYKGQGGSSGNIHDSAHLSGGLLFEKLGFEGIGRCSVDFAFGCYHGFLDKAFAKSLDKLEDAYSACLTLEPTLSGPVASCIHGIGHGVASFYSVSDLNKALATCRKLTQGSEYCFDGVFMEFARNAPESHFKADDPLFPCNMLEEKYGYAYSLSCGRNQPSVLMGRFKMGFAEVVSVCLGSDSVPFKEACFDSLGFSLAATGDAPKIIQGCRMIGDEKYIQKCIKASAGELVFQEIPGWDQKSKEVCNSLLDTRECLGYVERLVSDYHRVSK